MQRVYFRVPSAVQVVTQKEFQSERESSSTVAHKCHGKRNNLTAKRKDSRQKETTSRQIEKPHGKKNGKKNNLTAKRITSRQKE